MRDGLVARVAVETSMEIRFGAVAAHGDLTFDSVALSALYSRVSVGQSFSRSE